ncbi:two-component system, NtrC family, sensor kinase [Ectothiorhodospira mobilis]|uniref:histidine kinase n=1 Tax=Ectothiorhodospira mobilis TaxID=195064 RepID=A0A1I4SW25_ECTMO|nr:ATP-binding protein [Ectothiorhodospira mobilis]SFM68738.1 two-component system, NtrC family, sensor kinase [Ectothiorhodospira mobilis]
MAGQPLTLHRRRTPAVPIAPMGTLLLRSLVLVSLYYAVALWGFLFTPDPNGVALVWPATGVGLALVLLHGPALLPAAALAAGLVSWQFHLEMMPLAQALGTTAATLAGVALGARLLRGLGFSPRLERVRDTALLLGVGALAASALAAAAGAWGLALGGRELDFTGTWWRCWMADLTGLMLVTPALLTWLDPHAPPLRAGVTGGWGMPLLLVTVTILVTGMTYSPLLPPALAMPLSYAVFPAILFSALRCPLRITTGLILVSGAIALSGTGLGFGPFADMGQTTGLLSLNAQLALLALTGLLLAALRAEREAERERARRHLDELARAGRLSTLGALSSGLAHELNQPLCAVSSYAQACRRLLARGRLQELAETLERLEAGTRRAAETVRQIRSFASGQAPPRHTLDPATLVHEVEALLRPELRRRGVHLVLKLPEGIPPLQGTPLQVQQVLLNLLHNAMEAAEGRQPAQVCLELRREGKALVFIVTDTGPGIPPQRMERLFEPFATWKRGGLGLGLSISRDLVEAHGGRLSARNPPRGGAEFRFDLPLEDPHDVPAASPSGGR